MFQSNPLGLPSFACWQEATWLPTSSQTQQVIHLVHELVQLLLGVLATLLGLLQLQLAL